MIFLKTGIQIDVNHKKVRKYSSFLILKFGKWIDLSRINLMKLKYNSNKSAHVRPIYLAKEASTILTFDLILYDTKNNGIKLNDFTDLKLAHKVFNSLKDVSTYDCVNEVADNMMKNKGKK